MTTWLSSVGGWLEAHQAILAVVSILVAIVFGVPPLVEAGRSSVDRRRSTDALVAGLRATGGRVKATRLENGAIGLSEVLPIDVRIDDAEPVDGVGALLEGLRRGQSTVLLGEGGAGKSELLHQVHWSSYRADAVDAPLVEVVNLAQYGGRKWKQLDLPVWESRQIASRYRSTPEAIRRLVDEARIVIAFDALDEAGLDVRKGIVDQLLAWSRTHPVVVSSRRAPAETPGTITPEQLLSRAPHVRVASMQPLDADRVVSVLRSSSTTDHPTLVDRASSFVSPLRLQLLLFTARQRALTPSDVVAVANDSHALVARVIRADGRASDGPDAALRFAAVLSADRLKGQGVAFRLAPFALSGTALGGAKLLVVPLLIWFGVSWELTTSAITMGAAMMVSSPYEWQNPFLRVVRAAFSGWPPWARFVLRVVIVALVVHVVRVTTWSLTAGSWTAGGPEALIDPYWVLIVGWCVLFVEASPFSAWHELGYTRYIRQHAWPHFVAFALAVAWFLLIGHQQGGWAAGAVLYFGGACADLTASFAAAWWASGSGPWHWRGLARSLVDRGVLSRDGDQWKFVHADVEQHLLWEVAADPSIPRSVWRVYGRHWVERMLSRRVGRTGIRPGRSADRVIDLLTNRFAWSPMVHDQVIPYLSWTRLDPQRTLDAVTRHARKSGHTGHDPRRADALDRVGDPEGLRAALRWFSRLRNRYEATWTLWVLERHPDDERVIAAMAGAVVDGSRSRRSGPAPELGTSEFVAARVASGRNQPESLPSTPEEVRDECLRAAERTRSLAVANARIAQAAHHAGFPERAASIALFALDAVRINEGYEAMVEVMLTAAVFAADDVAADWLDRAVATGLRVVDHHGMSARLPESRWGGALVLVPSGVRR